MRIAILTLGCRVNQSESSAIEASLRGSGASIVAVDDSPDVCIVNTCSVTAKGDHDSRQMIRRAAKAGARVIVTGCYSQLRREEVRRLPGVVEVVENSRKEEIVGIITGGSHRVLPAGRNRSRPLVKVQDGCNRRCSYCTVPFARGKSRSVSLGTAVENVRSLEESGFQEVVLTGVHLGSYGADLGGKLSLSRLLKEVLSKSRIPRIRLSSIEVSELTEDLLSLLDDPRVCRHLHLPLQSGSERVLRLMNRSYTVSAFREKVRLLVERIPGISLGTDVISGFPGERDSDFAQTSDVIRDIPFSYLHVFPFSPRPGTEAATMPERVEPRVIRERVRQLKELSGEKKTAYLLSQASVIQEVVVEEEGDGYCVGTSSTYLRVKAQTGEARKGGMLYVMPRRVSDGMLEGSVIP